MSNAATYALRLPRSLKEGVERAARRDGVSMNQLIATAVAEKLSALETRDFFERRAERADYEAFDRIMRRTGGQPPREDDQHG